MRVRSYVVSLVVFVCFLSVNKAHSSILYSDNIYEVSRDWRNRFGVPAVKVASVSFLKTGVGTAAQYQTLNIETRCKMAGYHTTQSACTTKGLRYGIRCSEDKSLIFGTGEQTSAQTYVAGCCGKEFTVEDPKDCPDNSSYSGERCFVGVGQASGGKYMYECTCNRNTYPFGDDNPCASGYSGDESRMCKSDGKKYYASCCPTSGSNAYKQCSSAEHKVGSGNNCVVNGVKLSERCVCDSRYDYRKANCSTFVIDGNDYCRDGSVDYIQRDNCYTVCSDNTYQDLDRFYKNDGLKKLYDLLSNLGLKEE